MITLASGVSYLDLRFQNLPGVIATAVLHGPGGVALVDPGPSSTLPTLRATLVEGGLSMAEVGAVLLTHIHLDHAGATGTLVRDHPWLRVYVHEKGAPHLIDPEKLLASATRLYGDAMDRLWGEVRPVPPPALIVLKGGEHIEVGGRAIDIEYTPGHASHHVSYFNRDTGVAFVGDTAGIKLAPGAYVLPPTPPPDIDLEAWQASLVRIGRWGADTLFLTHFGPSAPEAPHVTALAEHLELVSRLAKASLAREGTDEARSQWFVEQIRGELGRWMSEAEVAAYEVAGRFDLSWRGLARYWRTRGARI